MIDPDGDFIFSSLHLPVDMANDLRKVDWSRMANMRFRFSGFVLDADERRLLDSEGREVVCAPKTLDALRLLVENGGQLVSREAFHGQLWPRTVVADETLAKLIWQVRKALTPDGDTLVETVPRYGYRLRSEVTAEPADSAVPDNGSVIVTDANTVVPDDEGRRIATELPAAWRKARSTAFAIVVATGLVATLGYAIFHGGEGSEPNTSAGISAASEFVSVGEAEIGAGVDASVGTALSNGLALDLGLEVAAPASPVLKTDATEGTRGTVHHRVSATGSGSWLWVLDPGQERPSIEIVIDPGKDARTQIQAAADRLFKAAELRPPATARSPARDLMLPRSWSSLRAYVAGREALMRRQGQKATEILSPLVVGEPGFVPAWLALARGQYLQADDSGSAHSAREGLARAAQAPAWLRLALETQLDEAEGRIDEAAERAYALHLLAPDRYDATLTAARLAGHDAKVERFDRLITHAGELRPDLPEVDLLRSVILLRRGRQQEAIASADRAAEKALDLGWQDIAAEALLNSARAHGQNGEFEEGLRQIGKAREILKVPNQELLAQLALIEGSLLFDRADFAGAEKSLGVAEAWFRPRGATFELSSILNIQRDIAMRRGDKAGAAALARESLRLAEASGDRYLAAAFSVRMARAYLDAGEVSIAKEWFSSAVTRAKSINNPDFLAETLNDWAHSAWRAGSEDEARVAASQSLEVALSSQNWSEASEAAAMSAEITLAGGDAATAARLLGQAQDYAQRVDDALLIGESARGQAILALDCSRSSEARQRLETARQSIDMAIDHSRSSAEAMQAWVRLAITEADLAIAENRLKTAAEVLVNAERQMTGMGDEGLRAEWTIMRAWQLALDGEEDKARSMLNALGDLQSRGRIRLHLQRRQLVALIKAGNPAKFRPVPPASCSAVP
jgi:DNA-binding winged helix-turn-helix (wHTH) protein/tetratricopeptide (TPR) repeat protein